jgi:hypothetical protein
VMLIYDLCHVYGFIAGLDVDFICVRDFNVSTL